MPSKSPHTPCPCSYANSRIGTKCAAEFLGTFILVHTICLSANSFAIPAIPIGLVLAALVYQMGHISGAQFNPAVSVGVWIAGGQDIVTTVVYIVSQIAGAILSGIIAAHVAKQDYSGEMSESTPMFPSVDINDKAGIWTEFLFTFLLVSTVLNVAVTKSPAYKDNAFFGIAIGFSLMAGVAAGAAFSGAAYNPAVVLGVNTGYEMFVTIRNGLDMDCSPMGNVGWPKAESWIVIIAMDFLGGIAAGVWFLWTERRPESELAEFEDSLMAGGKTKSQQ